MKIFGYYCVYPEKVEEHPKVAAVKNRRDRLIALDAPRIILDNEDRMYGERRAYYADLEKFRQVLKEIEGRNESSCINSNYDAVFAAAGLETGTDHVAAMLAMCDSELLEYIKETQALFDVFAEKNKGRLTELREIFLDRIRSLVKKGNFPKSALDNTERLRGTAINFDDGHETFLNECSAWFNMPSNQIRIAASAYRPHDALLIFHELMHGMAGETDSKNGFVRLSDYMLHAAENESFSVSLNMMNESFSNMYSIALATSRPSERIRNIKERDSKIFKTIMWTGKEVISQDALADAYFSADDRPVKLLAEMINRSFDTEELFCDFAKIKDTECTECHNRAAPLLEEHRYENIDSYYRYRCSLKGGACTDEETAARLLRGIFDEN